MECISLAIFRYTILCAYYADYYILIKLQFKEIDLITRREDNAEVRSKMLSLMPQVCKRLGINKSTLWYMQKHIKEGKRINFIASLRLNYE